MGDEQRNKDVVRKVEQAWVDGKLDELDQYFAADYPSHDRPPGVPQGLAGAKMMHQNVMKIFQGRKQRFVRKCLVALRDRFDQPHRVEAVERQSTAQQAGDDAL